MSDAISDCLSVSGSEQNTTKSQLLILKEKIDEIVQEYNKIGIPEIPKRLRKDLKDRLTLTWVSNTKGVSSTQWRKERAQDLYLQVLNACPHLYVAFISVIAPTACFQPHLGRTVTELLQLNKDTPVRLKLNSEAKEFFKSIAVAGAFTEDLRYIKFICSLFPEDRQHQRTDRLSEPPSPTETPDPNHSHPSVYGLSNTGQTSPKRSQHSVAQYTDSLGLERSVPVQSPALWVQQGSTTATAQLDGLRHSPETRSQHDHVVIRDMRNPTPQSQSGTATHYQDTEERPSKRLRLGSEQIPGNLELPGKGQYYSFSCMRRHMVENLPEPFRTGMKTNNLWRKEKESGGLAITNGLKMYLPVTPNEDTLLVLRLGYYQGFNIFDLFGLGDPDTPESEEAAAEDARD